MTTAEEQPDLVSVIITDGHRAVQDPRRPHRQANLTFGVAMQPDQYETVYCLLTGLRLGQGPMTTSVPVSEQGQPDRPHGERRSGSAAKRRGHDTPEP